jgi:hypothetical protein
MPKNRKRSAPAIRLGPVVKAIVGCICIALAGVGYVWQKNQIYALGEQMKKKEQRLDQLRLENMERLRLLSTLRSTVYLEERIRSLGLGLQMPHPEQIITLEDSAVQPADETGKRQYWARAQK